MSSTEILNKIDEAFKAITTTTSMGNSVLQPEHYNQYVKEATANKSILSEARFIKMKSDTYNLDRIAFGGRITESTIENTENTNVHGVTAAQEQLIAKKFRAVSGITDDTLDVSIEGDKLKSTLISLMGDQMGSDLEALAVWGDKDKYTSGSLLKSQDGWIKKATNKLYGSGTGKDFDPATAKPTEILSLMLKKYPRFYITQRSAMRFYVNGDFYDDYIDEVGERPTSAGDDAITTNSARPFKGVPVVECDVLSDTEGLDTTNGYGKAIMLQNPINMPYGIRDVIQFEPVREAKKDRTDFIMRTKTDQGYENPNVAVVALFDQTKPEDTTETPEDPPATPEDPPETRTVSVSVKDAAEAAIETAKVTLTNGSKTYECTTGSQGGCTISNVPDGKYTVTATATNYQNYTGAEEFTVSSTSTSLAITMTADT